MTTFRSRLTRALAFLTAAFLSVFCLALYLWCKSAFLSDLDGDLEALLRADFASHQDEAAHDHLRPDGEPTEFGEYEVFKLLVTVDGRVIKSTPANGARPEIPLETLERVAERGPMFATLSLRGELFRTLSSPVTYQGGAMVEVLGISQRPMLESLQELERALVVSLLLGIALVALVSDRLAGYLTRPLESVLGQLEAIAERGDPGERLSGQYVDQEMVSLQREINAMLERLDQSFQLQKQFVSNASHELRAPLSNLTLAVEVCLRRERTPQEYIEVLRTCHGETRRLSEMTNQLLTLSRTDEGALVVVREPTQVESFLRQCLERNEARARLKEVRLELDSVELSAELDPIKLGQVVDNLLDNAIRHSSSGQAVKLRATVEEDLLVIAVEDQGSGMTPSQRERLFERFYRADPSRQRGTGGAGLGLAISRALVEALGGKVSVESAPGEGTTVRVMLALTAPPTPAYSPIHAPS